MTQNRAILEYLQAGNTLTPLEALERFGTLALHSRISELRKYHLIECELIKLPNGKHVGRYSLQKIPYG